MRKISFYFPKTFLSFTLIYLLLPGLVWAENGAANCMQNDLQRALLCYLAYDDQIENNLEYISAGSDGDNPEVDVITYRLTSQRWPQGSKEILNNNIWQHTVKIYQPKNVIRDTALLYINGGVRNSISDNPPSSSQSEQIRFGEIAKKSGAIVIDLQDVPNQFLYFEGDTGPRKEDGIIAYSYNKVLENPLENAFWAGHLPMVKSVIKTMDALQGVYSDRNTVSIKHFVVSGCSKRGWAAWLTALSDDRVSALIPFVIDALNTLENIRHIENIYEGKWPPALKDYESQGVLDKLENPEMQMLLKIEDPLSYLVCDSCEAYHARYQIPKYIVNASGDDFFLPDSSQFYFSKLPGENLLRYVPNSSHYINKTIVSDALEAFFISELDKQLRPKLSWVLQDDSITLQVDQTPTKLILWLAHNEKARDFRFNQYPEGQGNIRFVPIAVDFTSQTETNTLVVPLPNIDIGWQAAFLEATFEKEGMPLVLTTEIAIRGAKE